MSVRSIIRSREINDKSQSVVSSRQKNALKLVRIWFYAYIVFGVTVIYSSTVIHSQNIYQNPYKFVMLHVSWLLLGFLAFLYFKKFVVQNLWFWSKLMFSFTIVLLVVLAAAGILPCSLNFPFAPCINSANRWFKLNPPPLPQIPLIGELGFQPSELAKLSLILFFSIMLPKYLRSKKDPFIFFVLTMLTVCGLVILQPNMSTSIIIGAIGLVVYFISGSPIKRLIYLLPIVLITLTVLVITSPYRMQRLKTLILGNESSQQESSYHINQVMLGLGSGGFSGVGFGQSKQKYYIPEVSSDSIFAIIGEEFGFLGSFLVVGSLIFALITFTYLFLHIQKIEERLVCFGIISWLMIQSFVHIAANTSLIPFTGVPLPFISYGGSSILFSMAGAGLIFGILDKEYN